MRRPGSLFATVSLILFAAAADAHELPSGNLAGLGRIWGIVRYAHPSLAYSEVDWDAAGLRAIQRVRMSPSSSSTLTAAVEEMLATLGDAATHVTRPCTETVAAAAADRSTRTLAEGVVYIAATSPATPQTTNALRNAKTAVIDLRPQPGRCGAPALADDLVPLLVRDAVPRAYHRKVRHQGHRSHGDVVENAYGSSFVTIHAGTESGASSSVANVVFIVDGRSDIPAYATALADSGRASFVAVGGFPLHTAIDYCQIGLPDLSTVTIRTSELVDSDGFTAEPAPMMTLGANASEEDILAAAVQSSRPRSGRRRSTGVRATRLPEYAARPDAAYADMTLPPVEHRILAAYRLWNIIDLFYADRDALGAWDAEFHHIIATLENADTRAKYELALAEIMALVPDGQALVTANAVAELRGAAAAPFRLMRVENKPVVVETFVDSVKRGDELLRIDGRDVATRIAELERYSFSDVTADLANGAAGSNAVFTFRRADGAQYDVTLARGAHTEPTLEKAWKLLDGNVAYVDMRHLDAEDVPALFTDAASTRALIFDLRNGSRDGAANAVAARIISTALTTVARVPDIVGGAYWFSEVHNVITPADEPRYTGRVMALVDGRTSSAAEEAAVVFEAIRATLVGSTTAGALGTTSQFVVPGNIFIRFTGTSVRDVNRRVVQGVGMTPPRKVAPTIRGLADGRDEVLEQAAND